MMAATRFAFVKRRRKVRRARVLPDNRSCHAKALTALCSITSTSSNGVRVRPCPLLYIPDGFWSCLGPDAGWSNMIPVKSRRHYLFCRRLTMYAMTSAPSSRDKTRLGIVG